MPTNLTFYLPPTGWLVEGWSGPRSTCLKNCNGDESGLNEALKYESDRHESTGEQEQGAFSVGFRRKKGDRWVWDQKKKSGFFCVNFPKKGVISCKWVLCM